MYGRRRAEAIQSRSIHGPDTAMYVINGCFALRRSKNDLPGHEHVYTYTKLQLNTIIIVQ